jgi:hypothetical protein
VILLSFFLIFIIIIIIIIIIITTNNIYTIYYYNIIIIKSNLDNLTYGRICNYNYILMQYNDGIYKSIYIYLCNSNNNMHIDERFNVT